jgi:hypothetical protein
VRPRFDDRSILNDDDPVGSSNGRETMRDGDGCSSNGGSVESGLDKGLGLVIQSTEWAMMKKKREKREGSAEYQRVYTKESYVRGRFIQLMKSDSRRRQHLDLLEQTRRKRKGSQAGSERHVIELERCKA